MPPIVTIQRLAVEFRLFFDRKILFGGSKENELEKLRFLQVFEKKCRFYDYDALVLQNVICYSFLLFTQKLVASRVTFSTCV